MQNAFFNYLNAQKSIRDSKAESEREFLELSQKKWILGWPEVLFKKLKAIENVLVLLEIDYQNTVLLNNNLYYEGHATAPRIRNVPIQRVFVWAPTNGKQPPETYKLPSTNPLGPTIAKIQWFESSFFSTSDPYNVDEPFSFYFFTSKEMDIMQQNQ